jgi:D-alanyl-D-alanine carboxypeptidase
MVLALVACGNATTAPVADTGPDPEIYLVLVNKTHQLPENWDEKIELVSDHDPWGEEVKIEKETFNHFIELREALLEQGVDIRLESVYRSVEDQITLWNYFKEQYGEDYCKQYVATPGYSEHHTGLAVDICLIKNGELINDNDRMIADVEDFSKIHAAMPDYGFIIRYPEGKEDITGYSYEPWHLRYVGSPEIAKEIASKGLTLEEYKGEN